MVVVDVGGGGLVLLVGCEVLLGGGGVLAGLGEDGMVGGDGRLVGVWRGWEGVYWRVVMVVVVRGGGLLVVVIRMSGVVVVRSRRQKDPRFLSGRVGLVGVMKCGLDLGVRVPRVSFLGVGVVGGC